jgi:glycosyltransferase involved in cell wall biosynthesis
VGKSFSGDPESSGIDIMGYINNNSLNNDVILLGFRRDVKNILPLLDIFCLVSYKEGLPISLIEAMAVGLPVIGADSVGIRDVISNGENGLLVNVDDVDDLKNKLVYLIENPKIRHILGKKAREEVINKYDINKCVLEYEKVFMSCDT